MRLSSKIASFLGVDAQLRKEGNSFYNEFKNGSGNEQTLPATTFLLSAGVPASVETTTYNVIKSFFSSKGVSEKYSKVLALLIIDAAKFQNISPMQLIGSFNKTDIFLTDDVMYAINLLNENALLTKIKEKSNSLSLKSQYIRV